MPAGRPTFHKKAMRDYRLTLTEQAVAVFRRLGNGNISAGARLAAEMCDKKKRPQRNATGA